MWFTKFSHCNKILIGNYYLLIISKVLCTSNVEFWSVSSNDSSNWKKVHIIVLQTVWMRGDGALNPGRLDSAPGWIRIAQRHSVQARFVGEREKNGIFELYKNKEFRLCSKEKRPKINSISPQKLQVSWLFHTILIALILWTVALWSKLISGLFVFYTSKNAGKQTKNMKNAWTMNLKTYPGYSVSGFWNASNTFS